LLEDAEADLIIGADGAHSKIRRIMSKRPSFNYSQTYIEDQYLELSVPSGRDNKVITADKHKCIMLIYCLDDLSELIDLIL